jgi:hypothetical protein
VLDGPAPWVSTDLRVFTLAEGEEAFGQKIGADPNEFIAAALAHLNVDPTAPAAFDALPAETAVLELAQSIDGTPRFNFAVARVHYISARVEPLQARVFFRLFQTATTGTSFEPGAAYRTAKTDPIPLLGLRSGQLVTIPCFAAPRVEATQPLTTQLDPDNVRTFAPGGAADAVRYFGCWLDVNHPEPRFPLNPPAGTPDGPWPRARLRSLPDLMRGADPCLVAEIHLADSTIPTGATPAGDHRLAQRDLVVSATVTGGGEAARTAAHTLEIKATTPAPRIVSVGPAAPGLPETQLVQPAGADELMIEWPHMPPQTRVALYVSAVYADALLSLARQTLDTDKLGAVDAHTLSLGLGDVTFVPLPTGLRHNLPALLSLELPEGEAARHGRQFEAIVHQLSGKPRRVIGSVVLAIPVLSRAEARSRELPTLRVLEATARAIPVEDRWHAVFRRYAAHVGERATELGR